MLNFSPVRIALILLYFLACTACGSAPDQDQPINEDESGTTATDINFIGGGTQAPDTTPDEGDYRSPTVSLPPPPTSITWKSSIGQAIRMAQRDEDKKIIVWFQNEDCVDCKTIKREVFNDPDVIAMTRNWIFVEVDTERMEDEATYLLAGGSPPAMVFLDKYGNGYKRYYGIVTSEEMIHMLKTWRYPPPRPNLILRHRSCPRQRIECSWQFPLVAFRDHAPPQHPD